MKGDKKSRSWVILLLCLTGALRALPPQVERARETPSLPEIDAGWRFALDRTLKTPAQPIEGLAFGGVPPLLAALSGDHQVRLWRASTGELVKSILLTGNPESEFGLAYSGDGKWIAVGEGFTKAAVVYTGKVELLDAVAGEDVRALTVHHWGVSGVAFSRDGRWLVTNNWDKKIRVLEFPAGNEVRTILGQFRPLCVAISPDTTLIAAGGTDATVGVWDRASGNELRRLSGHSGAIAAVDFSPDDKLLSSASADGSVRIWDVSTGQSIRTLSGHEGAVTSVAFSPKGNVLASGGVDGTIRIWDATTGRNIEALGAHAAVWQVVFNPDGRHLAAGYADGTINVWKKQ